MTQKIGPIGAVLAAASVAACATPQAKSAEADPTKTLRILEQVLAAESRVSGAELEAAIIAAAAHPLGSQENPVRAHGPRGQRAYLSRLRCADLSRPKFGRDGAAGMSPFGNIVDAYTVTCAGSEPAKSTIFMDMYHAGYAEVQAVPGFGIMGGQSAE